MEQRAAVIEVLDRGGHVRSVHKVPQWPARIGRSPACDIVLDDAHLAPEHAELDWSDEGGARLRLLPSVNGGWLGERRLETGENAALDAQALFQLGATQLRWRSTAAPLPAELPLERHQLREIKPGAWWLPGLLMLWIALLALEQWSGSNPGAPLIEYSAPVLMPLAILLGWAAVWSLITQLFQHRFPFATHLRRALVGLTGLQLLSIVMPVIAYALSWPRLQALEALLSWLGFTAVLWWHATLVWPRARRGLALGLAGLLLLSFGLNVAKRQQQQYWLGPQYLSTLPPPAFRLVDPKPPEALLESLKPLQAQLARQARKDNDAEAGNDGDE